jgi:fido (protein-threonine AMPylation protein)
MRWRNKVDKVILAGGSSHLAFVRQLVAKTLAGQTIFDPKDIVIGKDFEKAVAYGLAVEGREQRKTALRTHNSIGPCVFNPLYLYVSSQRGEPWVGPEIKRLESKETNPVGTLLPGPMQVGDFSAGFEVHLPFRPQKFFLYRFTDAPLLGDDPGPIPLNIEQDILRVSPHCPNVFKLKLDFSADGIVRPHFLFGENEVPANDFFFGGLRIAREIDSYAGIDFGTSNTYVVNLWSEPVVHDFDYPVFAISESAGSQLRKLELGIQTAKNSGLLTSDVLKSMMESRKVDFIFHSIKIEGSGLTRGETEQALSGSTPVTTKEMQEPLNVASAFDFIASNAAAYRDSPEGFIREINKIVLHKISSNPGAYRDGPVTLAGMDFEPPPALAIRPFVEKLAGELKDGPGKRSAVHFAAEVHAKLTAIHPFADGNGRTARLLANAILVDAGLPSLVIEFGDKERYLDCLKASNAKDLSPMCMFFGELIQEDLDELRAKQTVVAVDAHPVVPVEPTSPSQRLAEAVRKRVAALHIQRESRYKAWAAAFESFREEFSNAGTVLNETYKTTPFYVKFFGYDTLPLEKYEGLVNGTRTPKTWFNGCEIAFEQRREKFVFFFQGLSYQFALTARRKHIALPPRDVSLAVSRWADGVYRRLQDEPVCLREVAYKDGQLLFFVANGPGSWDVTFSPMSDIINNFFADAIEAFF